MKRKISVIMLTYNREILVSRAIESVLNQTYRDFEFIIVDNGSEDGSGDIAEEYAKKDQRIQIYHIPKSNIGTGRNCGLSHAAGEYVTFIDDDDWMYEDMLECLLGMAEKYNADIALCGSQREVEGKIYDNCCFDDVLVMNDEEGVIELLKRKKYNAAYPTKMLRKKLFDQIPFCEDGKYDDIAVVYKHFALSKCTVAAGIPKYCFCRHENNNSAFTMNDRLLTEEQLEEYMVAFRERTEWLSTKLPNIAQYAQYSEWSWMISMCNKIEKNGLTSCRKALEKIRTVLKENYDPFYNSEYIQGFEKEWMEQYIGAEE